MTWLILVAVALLLASAGYALTLWRSPPTPGPIDDEPSPVPWLADAVWMSWNRWPDPTAPTAIIDPQIRVASDRDREAAERLDLPEGIAVPEPMTPDEALAALVATPGQGFSYRQSWPLCCGHLATMVEESPGPFRYLEVEVSDLWALGAGPDQSVEGTKRNPDKTAVFVCRSCGSQYVGSRTP